MQLTNLPVVSSKTSQTCVKRRSFQRVNLSNSDLFKHVLSQGRQVVLTWQGWRWFGAICPAYALADVALTHIYYLTTSCYVGWDPVVGLLHHMTQRGETTPWEKSLNVSFCQQNQDFKHSIYIKFWNPNYEKRKSWHSDSPTCHHHPSTPPKIYTQVWTS